MVGSSLRELTPVRDDPDLDDLGDGVVATRLIQDVNIIPGLFKVDGYTRLLRWLEHALKLEAGRSLVPVPWDWRRDLRVAARQVARVAEESLAAWREMGNPEAKLVLIAHGEGGLVATWFTDVLGGYRDTRLLFTLGTPFRGTVQLLDTLVNGARAGIGRTSDLTAFTRSLSSPYQMLPTYPCIDAGGGELRRVDEVELPDLDRSRVYSGKQFLLQLADAGANRVLESDMQVVPVVGIGQATLQSARLLSGQLMALQRYGSEDYGGDGTVPRFSALPTWLHNEHGAVYCRSRHGQLQSQNQVLEMIEGRITALELVNFR